MEDNNSNNMSDDDDIPQGFGKFWQSLFKCRHTPFAL